MIKSTIKYSALAVSLFYFSCNNENSCDCLKSIGPVVTEERVIPAFNKLSLEDNVNLFITQDSVYSLTVEAGEHLLQSIKAEVTDSCLYLKNENKCNWVRSFENKINVYLRFKKLTILSIPADQEIYVRPTHCISIIFSWTAGMVQE